MTIYNWNAIRLGNAVDMDPDDANATAENASSVLGTYGSEAAPLRNNIVDVVANDADEDTNINYDDPSEALSIDGVSHVVDSMAVFNATITYIDGTTATITAVVFQTENGDLYLAPEMTVNADHAAMEAKPIRSLTLDSVNTDTTLMASNRQQTNFACFSGETRILTPHGERAVEALRPGDLICTCAGAKRPIRGVLSRRVSVLTQLLDPRTRPVLFSPDSLAPGIPVRPLRVSQQHRMMLSSPIARRMFGHEDVLVAAKKLLCLPGVSLDRPSVGLVYVHIALDSHDILLADGAPAESLFRGRQTARLAEESDLCTLPLRDLAGPEVPARPIIEGKRLHQFLARLANRHARHGTALAKAGL